MSDLINQLRHIGALRDLRGYAHQAKVAAGAAADEIERLQGALEDAIETLEAMDLHIDNPLYERLRAILEGSTDTGSVT